MEEITAYLKKSRESLASAKDDLRNKRYNSCANRAYYACYQAAAALLIKNGLVVSKEKILKHEAVQAQIATLIKRRKILPSEHRDTLPELMSTRATADYAAQGVGQKKARRVLKKAKDFATLVSKEVYK